MKNTQIFFYYFLFFILFTCPNSIIKTEKHCTKYVQSETENKFCKTKCAKLNFYKNAHFVLFLLLSTRRIYHLRCFPISFHFLFHFTLILYITIWFSAFFAFPPRFQTKILRKQLLQLKNQHSPMLTPHNRRYQINAYII